MTLSSKISPGPSFSNFFKEGKPERAKPREREAIPVTRTVFLPISTLKSEMQTKPPEAGT